MKIMFAKGEGKELGMYTEPVGLKNNVLFLTEKKDDQNISTTVFIKIISSLNLLFIATVPRNRNGMPKNVDANAATLKRNRHLSCKILMCFLGMHADITEIFLF